MRSSRRRSREEEEEESVFVPMTDMTVSFLFIVIILLAFFASQFSTEDTVPRERFENVVAQRDDARADRDAAQKERDEARRRLEAALRERDEAREERDRALAQVARLEAELETARERFQRLQEELDAARTRAEAAEAEVARLSRRVHELEDLIDRLRRRLQGTLERYLTGTALERERLLRRIRDELRVAFPELDVRISEETDALRFQGEGLFRSGSAQLRDARAREIVRRIAEVLDANLPCYTFGERAAFDVDCNAAFAVVEAVLVEGHTDDQGSDAYNLQLSAQRGAATVNAMLERQPGLLDHLNVRGEPILGLAGYGESRPVDPRPTPEARRANRRIDLRVIMYSPVDASDVEDLKSALEEAVGPWEGAR